jgi:hypothetical protein
MNGSKGNAAFNASEKPERSDLILNLNTARRMLPLVKRVVEDILGDRKALVRLQPEIARLDRQKRDLAWQERQRRYRVHDEAAVADKHLQDSLEELHTLGLTLLDGDLGQIGFPTIVNDRRAYFTWQLGQDTLVSWQFEDERASRAIPASWWKVSEASMNEKI